MADLPEQPRRLDREELIRRLIDELQDPKTNGAYSEGEDEDDRGEQVQNADDEPKES